MRIVRRSSLALLIGSLIALLPARSAEAEEPTSERATDRGQLDLRVGVRYSLYDSWLNLNRHPSAYLMLGVGYYLRDNLRLGVGVTTAANGDVDDSYDAGFFSLTRYFKKSRIGRPFATVAVGFFMFGSVGFDVISDDGGARYTGAVGYRLALPRKPDTRIFVEPELSLILDVSHSNREWDVNFGSWDMTAAVLLAVPLSL